MFNEPMTDFIKVEIGEYTFRANLLKNKAPKTCEVLLKVMPIKGRVIQARWSGEAVWLQMDPYKAKAPNENPTSHPSIGHLLYYPGGISKKEILIPYGSTCFASKVGMLPGNHFATITEGIEKLPEMGNKVLWEGAQKIKIEYDI
jgi:hypothetical protein